MEKIHTDVPDKQLEARKQNRDEIDLLRSRLVLLDTRDKVLMTMYLENGNSFRQIARLLGVSEATISRKADSISGRRSPKRSVIASSQETCSPSRSSSDSPIAAIVFHA